MYFERLCGKHVPIKSSIKKSSACEVFYGVEKSVVCDIDCGGRFCVRGWKHASHHVCSRVCASVGRWRVLQFGPHTELCAARRFDYDRYSSGRWRSKLDNGL